MRYSLPNNAPKYNLTNFFNTLEMADESGVVKQELGHENGQENDQEMVSQEPESELKPDVDELMRKIEEEKEKR